MKKIKCPKCKKNELQIETSVAPKGINPKQLGWNKEHTEYTEGVICHSVECKNCGFNDCDVSVYD